MNFKSQDTTPERAEQILTELQAQKSHYSDEIIALSSLQRSRDTDHFHRLVVHGEPLRLPMTAHAEGQLLTRLRIPAGYLHRCPLWLQAEQINHWIKVGDSKDVLLRMHDEKVRAIFSTRYKADMDDHRVIPFVLDALQEDEWGDNIHIKSFHKDHDFTELTVLFKDAKAQHDCGICFAGIVVVNSEVGKSSLWVKPLVRYGNEFSRYDLVDKSKEGSTSFRHTGEMNQEKILTALKHAREVSEVGIYRVFEANQIVIENVVEETTALVEEHDFLAQNLVDIIEEEYQNGVTATKLQLAESILRAVKDLPLFKRYHAECAVGRYLDIFGDTKSRLEDIVSDIEQIEK